MAWILFFDGDCAFCSHSVRRVFACDTRAQIHFASLQGPLAREKGFAHFAAEDGGSMVLFRETDGKTLTLSDALIQLTRIFGGFWRILTLAQFIPKPCRDWVYRGIARNRHRLMRKSDACSLPTPEFRERFRD